MTGPITDTSKRKLEKKSKSKTDLGCEPDEKGLWKVIKAQQKARCNDLTSFGSEESAPETLLTCTHSV